MTSPDLHDEGIMSTEVLTTDVSSVYIVLGLLCAFLFVVLLILLVCLVISYRRYKKSSPKHGPGKANVRRYLEQVTSKKAASTTAFDDVDSVDIYSTQRSHRMGINAPMAFIDMPPIEMYENGHVSNGHVPSSRDRSVHGGGGGHHHRSSSNHRYVRRQRNTSGHHTLGDHQSPVAKKVKNTRHGGHPESSSSFDMSGRYAAFSARSDSPDNYSNHALETDSPERYSQTDDFY